MSRKKTPGPGCADFTPEDFKYRIDEFLTSGHDDKGQSLRLMCRVPPQTERALETVLYSRRFPYQTVADILRHAVIRHLEWLSRMEPDMPRTFVSALQAINEVIRDSDMMSQMQQTFSKLDAMVEHLLATGDRVEAQRVLSVANGQLSKIPDSRWKRIFQEQFSSKYARHFGAVVPTATHQEPRLLEFPARPTSPAGETGEGPGFLASKNEEDE